MNGEIGANGVWKWIAAILAAIIIAGIPGVIQSLRAPSQAEVDLIRERQNVVLQRLAAIDIQIQTNQAILMQLEIDVREHIETDRPR